MICRDRLALEHCVGLSDLSAKRRVKCIEAPQRLGVEAGVAGGVGSLGHSVGKGCVGWCQKQSFWCVSLVMDLRGMAYDQCTPGSGPSYGGSFWWPLELDKIMLDMGYEEGPPDSQVMRNFVEVYDALVAHFLKRLECLPGDGCKVFGFGFDCDIWHSRRLVGPGRLGFAGSWALQTFVCFFIVIDIFCFFFSDFRLFFWWFVVKTLLYIRPFFRMMCFLCL